MFELAGQSIKAGEQRIVNIPLMRMFTHNQLSIPVKVIVGKKKGPTMFVCAAIHGDEVAGVEIIRRLIKQVSLKKLRGNLILVPVVNVHGLLNRSRYLPDRRDLNRSFPGSEKGSLASRVASVFIEEVVDRSDFGIDLHSGAVHRDNFPHIRANLDNKKTLKIANAFGTPVVLDSDEPEGSLRASLLKREKPIIVFEGGEALRLDEIVVKSGLKGILSVLRHLKMLPELKVKKKASKPFIARSSSWVRAPESGLFRASVKLGERVEKGEVLGKVSDPLGEREVNVLAKFGGIVIGNSSLPLVHEGEALFHIARFKKPDSVEKTLINYHNMLEKL